MERKKSKHTIMFPVILDMSRFMGTRSNLSVPTNSQSSVGEVYELRGVLLHKGPSAYHGHYEAQVFDTACVTRFAPISSPI